MRHESITDRLRRSELRDDVRARLGSRDRRRRRFAYGAHRARRRGDRLTLVLANLTVADAAPLALIDAAAEAGYDAVNVWLTPPPAVGAFGALRRDAPGIVGDRAAIAALRARCDATGVRIFSGSAGWIGAGFDPVAIAPVLETLAALGARAVPVVGWDDDRARLASHLAAICDAAAPYGLRVLLEFMPYSAVKTIGDADALLREIAKPNAAHLVDALHLARSGGTPADVAAIPAERIGSLQICDAPAARPAAGELRRESVTDRRYPGEGELPLAALLAAIPSEAAVEVEVPVARDAHLSATERARRAADATRRVLAGSHFRPASR